MRVSFLPCPPYPLLDPVSQILEYIAGKYGSDRVAQIATFSRMGSKAALRDVCRVQGVALSTVNQLAKLVGVARPRGT